MKEEAKQSLIQLLKNIKPTQPFTIECLTRNFLLKQGLDWQSIYEINAQVEIEKYLLEQELIKECGTTKLYNIGNKVEKL